jgi:hypothetical protein
MKKRLLLATILCALAVGTAAAWNPLPTAIKLPKCSGQLCQKAGCSADTLCARGTSVVTCAEVCGGH